VYDLPLVWLKDWLESAPDDRDRARRLDIFRDAFPGVDLSDTKDYYRRLMRDRSAIRILPGVSLSLTGRVRIGRGRNVPVEFRAADIIWARNQLRRISAGDGLDERARDSFSQRVFGQEFVFLSDSSYGDSLSDLIAEGGLTVKHLQISEIPLVLFDFTGPDQPGCSITVTSSEKRATADAFRLSVLTGTAQSSRTYSVKLSASFTASAGERKRLFAIFPLFTSYRVHFKARFPDYSQPQDMRTSTRSAIHVGAGPNSAIGATTASAEIPLQLGSQIAHFPLSGDQGSNLSTYEYEYESTDSLIVRIGAESSKLHSSLSLEKSISLQQDLTLRCTLRSGWDYRLYRTADRGGITWRVSR